MSIFKETISKLLEVAESDGVVTSEELELLDQIRVDAESFQVNLDEALSDGIINEVERSRLEKLKQMIMDRAEIVANIDGRLSDDERNLLILLKKFLDEKFTVG